MSGFKSLPSALGRWTLAAGLLMSWAARTEAQPRHVQFSDGFDTPSAADAATCPTFECPPDWAPGSPALPSAIPSRSGSAPGLSSPQPANQRPETPASPSRQPTLPQADPRSPVPAPFTANAQPAPSGVTPAGFSSSPGLAAATAPASVAPNMIGDFFGGISSKPTILPGNILTQAIFLQPVEAIGGPALLDYYRGVDPLGGTQFQSNQFVYIASQNGRNVDAMPSQVPPQLLREFDDGGLFVGDPADLAGDPAAGIPGGFVSLPGPFIALDSGQVGDVDLLAPETVSTLLAEPLFNIHDALLIFVPSPGSGGGVGRQKIAENTSPIPRDRVFINHSTFTGVPLTGDGVNVYRFSPGIEKAFYEQRFSIEVRLPFASTLDSDISSTGGTDRESTEFGNIVTTLKALVRQTCNSAVAVGVSVTAPTHADLDVVDGRGASLLTVENESVHVMPFIGGTHNSGRWFGQWYLQGDFDTTGSPVQIRDVLTGTLNDAGDLNDAAFLYASLSGGYWVYQNGHRAVSFDSAPGRSIKRTVYTGGSGITGLAPIAEFHFNQSLDKGETISSGPIQYQSPTDFSLGNLVLGGMLTFGTGGSITAAWGTPVLGQDDAQFDHEVRVILDYEF